MRDGTIPQMEIPPTKDEFLLALCWSLVEAMREANPEDAVPPADTVDYEILWDNLFVMRHVLLDDWSITAASEELRRRTNTPYSE